MTFSIWDWLCFAGFAVFVTPLSAYLIAKLIVMGVKAGREHKDQHKRNQLNGY